MNLQCLISVYKNFGNGLQYLLNVQSHELKLSNKIFAYNEPWEFVPRHSQTACNLDLNTKKCTLF